MPYLFLTEAISLGEIKRRQTLKNGERNQGLDLRSGVLWTALTGKMQRYKASDKSLMVRISISHLHFVKDVTERI